MKYYTESRDIDKVSRLQGEVSDVKDILVKNIGKVCFFSLSFSGICWNSRFQCVLLLLFFFPNCNQCTLYH